VVSPTGKPMVFTTENFMTTDNNSTNNNSNNNSTNTNNTNNITSQQQQQPSVTFVGPLEPYTWRFLYDIYKSKGGSVSPSESLFAIQDALTSSLGFSRQAASRIATLYFPAFQRAEVAESRSRVLLINPLDIKNLNNTFYEHKETSSDIRRLLTSFAVYAAMNPHHSHWIKYDRKFIFYIAGLDTKKPSVQESLVKTLHDTYHLDFQVVGSNSPIACFRLPWHEGHLIVPSENIIIGDCNPAVLSSFVQTEITL